MFKLLRNIGLLSPVKLFRLLISFRKYGKNFLGYLHFLQKTHSEKISIDDGEYMLNYEGLFLYSKTAFNFLTGKKGIRKESKVAIIGFDGALLTATIVGLSATGCKLILINPHLKDEQLNQLLNRIKPSHVLSDFDNLSKVSDDFNPIDFTSIQFHESHSASEVKMMSMGPFTVMTSGTTGVPKGITRKSSIATFIPPFKALINELELYKYSKIYIATPSYHGFGISALFIALILGVEIHMNKKFDVKEMASTLKNFNIEVLTAVPLMLDRLNQRIEETGEKPENLKCIISGGAALHETTLRRTESNFGNILWNLYGTSEAGFCIMSTPKISVKDAGTIGKPIKGVKTKIEKGELMIQAKWAIQKGEWIPTGDSARIENGYIYLNGRTDDMIVSGGENVYPINLQKALMALEEVRMAAVVPVKDEEFGQRFEAFIELNKEINSETIMEHLKSKLARFEMPRKIHIREKLPLNPIGKVNKKEL